MVTPSKYRDAKKPTRERGASYADHLAGRQAHDRSYSIVLVYYINCTEICTNDDLVIAVLELLSVPWTQSESLYRCH